MKIFNVMQHGEKNKKVIFLLGAWTNKPWMLYPTAKILAINGYYCITYSYNKNVLSPNTNKTVKDLLIISDDIFSRIKRLQKKGYKDFSVFGTSLGSIIALIVANKSSSISKIILNTIGIDIASIVWSWDKTRSKFKKSLIKQGYTLNELQKKWELITPLNNINKLHNKRILIYLAKKDDYIPYKLGKNLLQEFKNRKYNHNVIINNNFKHLLVCSYNLLNFKKYLDFLKLN